MSINYEIDSDLKTPITYPELEGDTPTQQWQTNWDNPAEDHWLVRSDSFIGDGNRDSFSADYRETRRWLADRFFFSWELADVFCPHLGDDNEAQITLRPCNNRSLFFRSLNPVKLYPYYHLFLEHGLHDRITDYFDELADQFLLPIRNFLLITSGLDRPSHFIISYDDDYDLLYSLNNSDGCEEIFARYCRAKKLFED